MGGYENLSSSIPGDRIAYDHVARELLGGYGGQPGSVPPTVMIGDTASFKFTTTLQAGWDPQYIRAVGVLIDGNGEIDNAGKSDYLDGNSNAKPLFISGFDTVGYVNTPYQLEMFVTDPDDQNLSITALNIPTWLSLSPETHLGYIHSKATLSGTPLSGGTYPVEIMVSDGSRSDTLSFDITVNASLPGNWQLVGGQGFTNADWTMDIAVDSAGTTYALVEYNNKCNVYSIAQGGSWSQLGALNGDGYFGKIRIGSDGVTPYVMYGSSSGVYVTRYVNGTWSQIGGKVGDGVQAGF